MVLHGCTLDEAEEEVAAALSENSFDEERAGDTVLGEGMGAVDEGDGKRLTDVAEPDSLPTVNCFRLRKVSSASSVAALRSASAE